MVHCSDARPAPDKYEYARSNAAGWLSSIVEMIGRLDSDDEETREAAETEIHEAPLSLSVRNGWYSPSAPEDQEGPEEYEILLSTGGPALRIFGRIGEHFEPTSAELQMQDWYIPWERYPAPEAVLLRFVQQFYFG